MLTQNIFREYNGPLFKTILVSCVGLLTSLAICGLSARSLVNLVVALAVAILLLGRPEKYVLAFWAFCLLGSNLIEILEKTTTSVLSVQVNPLGLLNGLLPLATGFLLLQKRPNLTRYPAGVFLIALLSWATISLGVGGYKPDKLRDFTTLLNMVAAYFVLNCAFERLQSLRKITIYIAVTLVVFNFGVIFGVITGSGMIDATFKNQVVFRSTGFAKEAQGTGELLALAAGVSFAFIIGPKKMRKLWLLFCFLIAGLLLTQSRTAMIALTVSCGFLLWRHKKLSPLYISLVFLLVLFLALCNKRLDIINVVSGEVDKDIYVNFFARVDYWKLLIDDMSLKTIALGHGIRASFQKLGSGAHNEYVAYLYDFGIVGLGLLVATLVSVFKYVSNLYNNPLDKLSQNWALAAMGAVISASICKFAGTPFSSPFSSYSFWLIVVITYQSYRIAGNAKINNVSESIQRMVASARTRAS